jgi:hypothetical protein
MYIDWINLANEVLDLYIVHKISDTIRNIWMLTRLGYQTWVGDFNENEINGK